MTEAEEIAEVMAEFGFRSEYLAGGCYAYQLNLSDDPDDPPHIRVSSHDVKLPNAWDEHIIVGKYAFDGDDEATYEEFDTVRAFVDAVRAGRSLVPQPQPSAPPVATPIVDARDLEAINRHRKGLGMEPIDLGAGWSDEELRKMAENIRTTGRMENPVQVLKRRLMR